MKKTKLALISMIVFIAVFSLTVIFDIQAPSVTSKGKHSGPDVPAAAESELLAEKTKDAEIKSFSIDESQDTSPAFPSITPTAAMPYQTAISSEFEAASSEVSNYEAVNPENAPTAAATPTPEATEATPVPTEAPEPEAKYADIGISIAKDYVNIREKASTDSDVLGKLYKGSAAEILKAKGDWYYVESGSVKGYVKSDFIKTGIPDDEIVKKYGTLSISVTVDGLNVRSEPSTDSKKMSVIYKNEIYPVVKVKNDWIEIKISDEKVTGYVKSEFANVQVEFKEAVSKEEEEKLKQLAAEEKAKKETEVIHSNGVSYTKADLRLLTCLIHAEAGTQSYEGKLAVANVVLNRVKSSKYPDSIKAVIYSPGQFSVASSGSLQKQLDRYDSFSSKSQLLSLKAAKDALEGANNIGSRLYFHSYGAAVKKGYDDKSSSVKIGGLLFW